MRSRRTAVPKLQQCAASADGNGNDNILLLLYSPRSPSLALCFCRAAAAATATAETEDHVRHSSSSPPLPSPLGGWCSRARAASLFVCKWARKLVSRVCIYVARQVPVHIFYLSPGALLLFLYACLRIIIHARALKGTKKKKREKK
jgi:hypothetical protein